MREGRVGASYFKSIVKSGRGWKEPLGGAEIAFLRKFLVRENMYRIYLNSPSNPSPVLDLAFRGG